jgi:hypothetical protein
MTTIGTFTFDTIGFCVFMEDDDGFKITASPWKAGMSAWPRLGVEDYRVSVAQRISGAYRKGPFVSSERQPTMPELCALRDEVRAHLAAIDRGEINV